MNFPKDIKWKLKLGKHYLATTVHKFWVFWYILKTCWALIKRGIVHDFSKYKAEEAEGFAEVLPQLNGCTYGSTEYQRLLNKLRPVLRKHYQNNRHHPEFYHDKNGWTRMSPIDRIEMLCDWKAATRRHADGDINDSIIKNASRFNYNELHKQGLLRDAEELNIL